MSTSASLADNVCTGITCWKSVASASFADYTCLGFLCWQCVRRLLLLTMCTQASLADNLFRRLLLLTICLSASFADNACVGFTCWQCDAWDSFVDNACVSFSNNALRRLLSQPILLRVLLLKTCGSASVADSVLHRIADILWVKFSWTSFLFIWINSFWC